MTPVTASCRRDAPIFVARVGVEYRNDLLGHVDALGLDGPPSRYSSGPERSEHPRTDRRTVSPVPNCASLAELHVHMR
jgi:hypothetical protein